MIPPLTRALRSGNSLTAPHCFPPRQPLTARREGSRDIPPPSPAPGGRARPLRAPTPAGLQRGRPGKGWEGGGDKAERSRSAAPAPRALPPPHTRSPGPAGVGARGSVLAAPGPAGPPRGWRRGRLNRAPSAGGSYHRHPAPLGGGGGCGSSGRRGAAGLPQPCSAAMQLPGARGRRARAAISYLLGRDPAWRFPPLQAASHCAAAAISPPPPPHSPQLSGSSIHLGPGQPPPPPPPFPLRCRPYANGAPPPPLPPIPTGAAQRPQRKSTPRIPPCAARTLHIPTL